MEIKFKNTHSTKTFRELQLNQTFIYKIGDLDIKVKKADGDYHNTLSLRNYCYYTTDLNTEVIPVEILEMVVNIER